MDDVYFETNHRNGLIYILTQVEVKNNKMLFNSNRISHDIKMTRK